MSAKSPPIEPDEFLPRVLSTKMEDGQFKPVYDPEDMKKWKIKKGLPLDDPPEGTAAASRNVAVSLLPVQTGGQDPHSEEVSRPALGAAPQDRQSSVLDAAPQHRTSAHIEPESEPSASTTDRLNTSEPARQPPKDRIVSQQGNSGPPREGVYHDLPGHGTSYRPIPPAQTHQTIAPDRRLGLGEARRPASATRGEPLTRDEPYHRQAPHLPAYAADQTGAYAADQTGAYPQGQKPPQAPSQIDPWVEPRRQSEGYNQGGPPRERDTWAAPRRQSDNYHQGTARPREFDREAEFSQPGQRAPYAGGHGQYEPTPDRRQQLAPRQCDAPRAYESGDRGRYQQAEMRRYHEAPRAYEPVGERYQHPEPSHQYDHPRAYDQDHHAALCSSAISRDSQLEPHTLPQPFNYNSHQSGHSGLDPSSQHKTQGREDALGWNRPPSRPVGAGSLPQLSGPPQPAALRQSTVLDEPTSPAQTTGSLPRGPLIARDLPQSRALAPPVQIFDREDHIHTPAQQQQEPARAPQPAQPRQRGSQPRRAPKSQLNHAEHSHHDEEQQHESVWDPPPREPSVAPSTASHETYGG